MALAAKEAQGVRLKERINNVYLLLPCARPALSEATHNLGASGDRATPGPGPPSGP